MTKIRESPLFWPAKFQNHTLKVLDETLIPRKIAYIDVSNTRDAVRVIRGMKTRAFGQFLVVLNAFLLEMNNTGDGNGRSSLAKIQKTALALNNSRPTFPFSEVTSVVVGWAQAAMRNNVDAKQVIIKNISRYLEGIRAWRLERVKKIADIIKNGDSILTHCNVSGELAMAAAICRRQGKDVHFFATETRPYMQGAKLTCWELKRMGAKVTLIADNAVGSLMADGLVNKVIVGSDRSCANGDIANKIGTYQIAVLAEEFGVPFYVLTQPSLTIQTGNDIPIEIRNAKELLVYSGKRIFRGRIYGYYPGFDVVPHQLITDSITININ